jgi:hypothetical protein
LPKITKEQKELFYQLYKQGYRGKAIATCIGMDHRYAQQILPSFDIGDYSWLQEGIRHYENVKTGVSSVGQFYPEKNY